MGKHGETWANMVALACVSWGIRLLNSPWDMISPRCQTGRQVGSTCHVLKWTYKTNKSKSGNHPICHHGPSCCRHANYFPCSPLCWPKSQLYIGVWNQSQVHKMHIETAHILMTCHLVPGERVWLRWIDHNIGQVKPSWDGPTIILAGICLC